MTAIDTPTRAREVPRSAEAAILATVSLSVLLVFGSLSMLTVAIPDMSRDLNGGVGAASWMIVGFLLANSTTILVFSKLSDEFGRRWFYFGGIVVYVVCSVVCATTSTDTVMMVARVVQGLAAASAVANSTAVITDVVAPERLALALGIHMAMAGAWTMLGPVAGGWLVDSYGWRSIFWATLPVGALAILVGWHGLRHVHSPPIRRIRFDSAGAVLSVVGVGAVIYGTQRADEPPVALLLVLGGVVVLTVFVLVERRIDDPILDLEVVTGARGRLYVASLLTALGFAGIGVTITLYMQVVVGSSATEAGLLLVPMGVAVLVAAPLSGLVARWMRPVTISTIGVLLMMGALLGVVAGVALDLGRPVLGTALAVIGFGQGIYNTSISHRLMDGVRPDRRGTANGFRSLLLNGSQAVSTSLVLAALTVISGAAIVGGEGAAPQARPGFVVASVGLLLFVVAGAVMTARPSRGPLLPRAVLHRAADHSAA